MWLIQKGAAYSADGGWWLGTPTNISTNIRCMSVYYCHSVSHQCPMENKRDLGFTLSPCVYWCCWEESNLRPTDYESVALPTELQQPDGIGNSRIIEGWNTASKLECVDIDAEKSKSNRQTFLITPKRAYFRPSFCCLESQVSVWMLRP